jgi:hypothetical protein
MKNRQRLSYKAQIEAQIAQRTQPPLEPSNRDRGLLPCIDAGPRTPGQPLWMPEGQDLDLMPIEVRQAVAEIIQPAYVEMVMNAQTGMEKSLGASIVHLLWLEVLDQFDIKKEYCKFDLRLGLDTGRKDAIDQYIKLINAKLRIGNFLIRLRELRQREEKKVETFCGAGVSPAQADGTAALQNPGIVSGKVLSVRDSVTPRISSKNSPTPEDYPNAENCPDEELPFPYPFTEADYAANRKHLEAVARKNRKAAPKNDPPEKPCEDPSPKTGDPGNRKVQKTDFDDEKPRPPLAKPPAGAEDGPARYRASCKKRNLAPKKTTPEASPPKSKSGAMPPS